MISKIHCTDCGHTMVDEFEIESEVHAAFLLQLQHLCPKCMGKNLVMVEVQ